MIGNALAVILLVVIAVGVLLMFTGNDDEAGTGD